VIDQKASYLLDEQIGFLLRKALQRNSEIFFSLMPGELTTTRFAVMAKLNEMGSLSQNELGRHTAMDVATTKGVVERLRKLDLVQTQQDPNDARKHIIKLTGVGEKMYSSITGKACEVSAKSLESLTSEEALMLTALLQKLTKQICPADNPLE
jgi:DNA-binding MarR family transcriptional regulator